MPIELGPFKSKRAGQLDRLLNALDRFHLDSRELDVFTRSIAGKPS